MISENGFDNIHFFMGIVEGDHDPTGNNRVKVRCFGIHPPVSTGQVKTKDLPWAVPLNGTYGGMTVAPGNGEWVFGFFADGRDAQHPMLIGSVPGTNFQQPSGSGSEFTNEYTKPSNRTYKTYAKPAAHFAQTGEELDATQVLYQNSTLKQSVTVAGGDAGWSEPETPVSQGMEKTVVWQSKYGNSYVEIGGDENAEVINISHGRGSHVSIDEAGNVKLRSSGDMYNISDGHTREYSEGRKDVYVNGSWTVKTRDGDATLEIHGDMNQIVHGDWNLQVGKRATINAAGGFEMNASRVAIQAEDESMSLIANHNFSMLAGENLELKSSKGSLYLFAPVNLELLAGGQAYLTGVTKLNLFSVTRVAINGGLAGFGIVTIQSPIPGLMALGALKPPGKPASPKVGDRIPAGQATLPDGTVSSVNAGFGPDAIDDFEDIDIASVQEADVTSTISDAIDRVAVDDNEPGANLIVDETNQDIIDERNNDGTNV